MTTYFPIALKDLSENNLRRKHHHQFFLNLHKTYFGHNILQSSLKFHHTFDIFFDVAVVMYTVTH